MFKDSRWKKSLITKPRGLKLKISKSLWEGLCEALLKGIIKVPRLGNKIKEFRLPNQMKIMCSFSLN